MIFSMAVIAPCITVETDEQYKEAVERLKPFAQRVHIDTSDGEFAPTFLTPPEKMWWPENWQVDIHAMVQRPAEYVDRLIALKPNQITFRSNNIVKSLMETFETGTRTASPSSLFLK